MTVIINELEIDLTEETQETNAEQIPADQVSTPPPITPLDLRDIWQREVKRRDRVRAH